MGGRRHSFGATRVDCWGGEGGTLGGEQWERQLDGLHKYLGGGVLPLTWL